jgi:hypothetical protein
MSDMSVPKTVRALSISRKDPARYISWFMRDSKSNGPVVGKLRTTLVMAEPEIKPGNIQPTVLMKGFIAILSGYFMTRRNGLRPLARAVVT